MTMAMMSQAIFLTKKNAKKMKMGLLITTIQLGVWETNIYKTLC